MQLRTSSLKATMGPVLHSPLFFGCRDRDPYILGHFQPKLFRKTSYSFILLVRHKNGEKKKKKRNNK